MHAELSGSQAAEKDRLYAPQHPDSDLEPSSWGSGGDGVIAELRRHQTQVADRRPKLRKNEFELRNMKLM